MIINKWSLTLDFREAFLMAIIAKDAQDVFKDAGENIIFQHLI